MSNDLIFYVSHYGYIAIFLLILFQETGLPNPIPNELTLIFSGYLAFTGTLNMGLIILAAWGGDLLAATILYSVFYLFGNFILYKKNNWLPISRQTIAKQIEKNKERGHISIIIGRLTPFIRGYIAVICGLLHIRIQKYGIIVFFTSALWSSFYIVSGYFLGPYWDFVIKHINQFKYLMYAILLVLFVFMIVRFIINKQKNETPQDY